MTLKERTQWLETLIGGWFGGFVVIAIANFSGMPRGQVAIDALLIAEGIFTLGYLLVLSWRMAYLSGRKK